MYMVARIVYYELEYDCFFQFCRVGRGRAESLCEL